VDWVQILVRPDEQGRVTAEFLEAWVTAGGPANMALFIHRRSGARVRLFVSPALACQAPDLVERLGGSPCGPPPRNFVELLCGHGDSLDRLLENTGEMCFREEE